VHTCAYMYIHVCATFLPEAGQRPEMSGKIR
jgi:hypothetical protein